MLKAYRIKHLSPHTEIRSYTLFGAFCWGYSFLKGKRNLKNFLEDFYEKPKFLISSPFPFINEEPVFPKPLLKLESEENISLIEKLKRKPYKKAPFISRSVLEDIIKGEAKTQNDLMKKYKVENSIIIKENENIGKYESKSVLTIHNQINRIKNISENLYFEKGKLLGQDSFFLVKFFDESFINEFEKILKIVEDFGLGGNKNIGWGKVKIDSLNKDFSFLENRKSNFFITLSPIIPAENIIPEKSLYNFITFKSFTDGTFGKFKTKNKILYIEEGSILCKSENSDFVGVVKSLGDVYQYGLGFPIYLGWNYESKN